MPSDTAPRKPRPGSARHGEILAVVLIYALFAAGWILLSDRVVQMIFSDPPRIILASILKGWFYVAVTALLLYGLMRRWAGADAAPNAFPAGSGRLGLPFIALTAAIVVFTSVGILHSFTDYKEEEIARLQAVASLKARHIADWLKERQGDADFVRTGEHFAEQYRRWHASGDPRGLERLQIQLEQWRRNRGFGAVMLLDPRGETLWESGKAPLTVAPPLQAALQSAMAGHKEQRVGPYRDAAGNAWLDFIVPMTAVPGPAPLVILRLDLADWLLPVLQAWPLASAGGEALLFRRDGDRVLFFNVPRGPADTTAGPYLLNATEKLPAARILRGEVSPDSPVEGVDYRGIPVIGVARAIAGTDWFLAVKLDLSALYAGAWGEAMWIGLVGLLALFMAGAGFHLVRQDRQLALAKAMQESQAERLSALNLLAAIADSSDSAIFAKDPEGRYILFNRAASHFVGKPAEAVLGRDDRAIFPPEQAERLMAVGRRVIAENRIHTQEEVLDTVDGERVFLTTKGPLRNAGGDVIGIFGISRDITDRKRAELALRASERRFHDIVNASADWVWEIDAQGRYTYASDSVRDMLGYAPEEILGRTPFDLMPPGEAARVSVEFAAICARREAFRDLDNINRHKDGSLRHVRTNGMPILDAEGKLLGYRGLDQDVTEKKQTEEQLRISEERLQLVLNATSDGLWDLDLRSGLAYLAPHYYEMTGYRPDQVTPDFEFFKRTVHPDDLPHVLETLETHMQGKTPVSDFDYRLMTPSGKVKWMRGRGRVVERDAGGAPLRMVGTITEISERKAGEEALRQQAEELALRNAELERFNRAMVGRELDMIALKQQVNALSRQLGQKPPFELSFLEVAVPDSPAAGDTA